jgi:hypothetical protein
MSLWTTECSLHCIMLTIRSVWWGLSFGDERQNRYCDLAMHWEEKWERCEFVCPSHLQNLRYHRYRSEWSDFLDSWLRAQQLLDWTPYSKGLGTVRSMFNSDTRIVWTNDRSADGELVQDFVICSNAPHFSWLTSILNRLRMSLLDCCEVRIICGD